jgi:SAM-dependent methyltransferase
MLSWIKRVAKRVPLLRSVLIKLRDRPFRSSSDYWEERYRAGGKSGAGSYNRLATFKAEFLNEFIEHERVESVLEFGCGDGSQLKLARYPFYMGVDIAPTAVAKCSSIFEEDTSKRFFLASELPSIVEAEATISLDVIYHLVEDGVFETYMQELFLRAQRFVIVYSSNREASWPSPHVRHREFTAWVELNEPWWQLTSTTPNPYPYDSLNPDHTSFADFYVFTRKECLSEGDI